MLSRLCNFIEVPVLFERVPDGFSDLYFVIILFLKKKKYFRKMIMVRWQIGITLVLPSNLVGTMMISYISCIFQKVAYEIVSVNCTKYVINTPFPRACMPGKFLSDKYELSNRYTMGCPPVRGDSPRT